MAHYFDCVVDTTDLARSVDTVNRHIDTTTGAVVAMKTAVIVAQQEGADHVCRNVNKGFYSLIHSQISQKMAALQSEVDAKLMQLHHQKKQLTGIRNRMTRDYQMICSRYAKLFTTINRALKQRVSELDSPVMELVNTDANKVSNRQNSLMAGVPVGQEESVKLSQRIATSNLKRRAMETISSITRFIGDSKRLDRVTNSILLRKSMQRSEAEVLAPVIIIESNYDESGNAVTQTYLSRMNMSSEAKSMIENHVSTAMHTNTLNWHQSNGKDSELTNQFRMLVNTSSIDERRRNTILRLFESNDFQTL